MQNQLAGVSIVGNTLYNVFFILSDDKRQIGFGEFIEPDSCEWYDLINDRVRILRLVSSFEFTDHIFQ